MLSSRRKIIAVSGGALALMLGVVAAGAASADNPADAARYPYDPACAWGRIANGHGMLVRCITKKEASAMLSHSKPLAKPAPGPSAAASAPMPPDAGVPDAQPPVPTAEQRIEAKVGPVTADEGTLPKAEHRLRAARKRFEQCVRDNGGLESDHAEVDVRFLVRGARGRAEGVSVKKRHGLGRKAARCVADVVDRRYVGMPAAPLVGATLVVKFSKVSR